MRSSRLTRELSYSCVLVSDSYQVCLMGLVIDVYRAFLNAHFVEAYPLKPPQTNPSLGMLVSTCA